MNIPLHELEANVMNLGDAERAHLLERLIKSFEPDTRVENAWIEEALRREADVKAGRSKMNSGAEALERIRVRLG